MFIYLTDLSVAYTCDLSVTDLIYQLDQDK